MSHCVQRRPRVTYKEQLKADCILSRGSTFGDMGRSCEVRRKSRSADPRPDSRRFVMHDFSSDRRDSRGPVPPHPTKLSPCPMFLPEGGRGAALR